MKEGIGDHNIELIIFAFFGPENQSKINISIKKNNFICVKKGRKWND